MKNLVGIRRDWGIHLNTELNGLGQELLFTVTSLFPNKTCFSSSFWAGGLQDATHYEYPATVLLHAVFASANALIWTLDREHLNDTDIEAFMCLEPQVIFQCSV